MGITFMINPGEGWVGLMATDITTKAADLLAGLTASAEEPRFCFFTFSFTERLFHFYIAPPLQTL